MGRGRQKAKQTKIARKLKYLTTDTDYDELAKELSGREPGEEHTDPFTMVEAEYGHADSSTNTAKEAGPADTHDSPDAAVAEPAPVDDDLDDYARWAAEAAAKATSGEMPVTPKPHKRIPIPVPSILGHHAPKKAATAKAGTGKSAGKAASKVAKGTKATGAKATASKTSESKSTAGKASIKTAGSKSAASKTASKASTRSGTGTSSVSKSAAGRKTTASTASAKTASTKESGAKKAGSKKAK